MSGLGHGTRSGIAALMLAGLLGVPAVAQAHMGSTKYVDARVVDGGVELVVHVRDVDAGVALGLGTHPSVETLARHQQLLKGWIARGLTVSSPAGPCRANVGAPGRTVRDGQVFLSMPVSEVCPPAVGGYTLRDDTVFADDPDHQTFVTVHGTGGESSQVLRSGDQSIELRPSTSSAATVRAYLHEGAVHLLTGWDHLLFVLSLVLVASLALRRDGMRGTLRDIGWIVTAFTIGHSISLAVAALGLVSLPSAWVEAGIAASIVLVALLNVFRPRPPTAVSRRRRAALAGGFGLVHGFGFSSVLADLGLSPGHRVLALASFNVGIELAQLAFVAGALVVLARLARHASYPRLVVQGGSIAIAAIGCVWMVERTLIP